MKFFIIIFLLLSINSIAQIPSPVIPIGGVGEDPYFSPDSKLIITKNSDHLKVWDTKTGKLLLQNIYFFESVKSGNHVVSKVSPDSKKIILRINQTIKVFSLQNGSLISQFNTPNGEDCNDFQMVFTPDSRYVITAEFHRHEGTFISVWDLGSGKEIFGIKKVEEPGGVNDAGDEYTLSEEWHFHPIKVGSSFFIWNDAHLEGWDFIKKSKRFVIKRPDSCPSTFFNEEYFMFNNAMFETRTGEIISEFSFKDCEMKIDENKSDLSTLKLYKAISSDVFIEGEGTSWRYIGDSTFTYNLKTAKLIASSFNDKKTQINKDSIVILSPNLKKYITQNNGVQVWDAKSQLFLYSLETAKIYSPTQSYLNPTGKYLIFNRYRNNEERTISTILNFVKCEISVEKINKADGFRLTSFNTEGDKQFSLPIHEPPVEYNEEANQINSFKLSKSLDYLVYNKASHLSKDGKTLIVASSHGDYLKESSRIDVWDTEKRKLLVPSLEHNFNIWSAEISPDGSKIGAQYSQFSNTPSENKYAIVIWDVLSGKIKFTLEEGGGRLNSEIHFSPNGNYLAARINGMIKIWNSFNGLLVSKIENAAEGILFSSDSNYLLSFNESSTVVWQIPDGKRINLLKRDPITTSSFDNPISNSVFNETGQFIYTSNKNVAEIWDWKNNTKIDLVGHNSAISSVIYNSSQKKIYTFSTDGSNKIWNSISGKLLCTYYIIGDNDYFFQLPNGYYKSSKSAEKLVHYITKSGKIVSFEQLSAKFNRPDLILKALGNFNPTLVKNFNSAYLKRINKLGLTNAITSNEIDISIPELSIQNLEEIEYFQNKPEIKLRVLGNSKISIKRFNVWINEVPIFGRSGMLLKGNNVFNLDTLINIPLGNATNTIEISFHDNSGIESFREKIIVFYKPLIKPLEKLHFIGIGVDEFQNKNYNLSFCVKDIRDLAKSLKTKFGNNIQIDTLFNSVVTLENIKRLKEILNKTGINDKVIISFSGHGLLNKNLDYFLSTYNINFDQPEINGLKYEDFEDLLNGIPARKKLLLIDACHSGEVEKEGFENASNNAGLIKGMKKPTISSLNTSNNVDFSKSIEISKNIFLDISKGTGTKVIAAAAGNQYALEKNELKNGVFTYSILEVLRTYDILKINQLNDIVNKRVVELTNGLQTPTTRKDVLFYDWNLFEENKQKTIHTYHLHKILSDSNKLISTQNIIYSAKFSPDGLKIVTAGKDKNVKIWSAITGKLLNTLIGHDDIIKSVAFSPDGSKIISGSIDKTIKIWDSFSGKLIQNILTGSTVWSLNYSQLGDKIVSGHGNSSIKIWNANNGNLLSTLNGHWEKPVSSVNFNLAGDKLASGGYDANIIIWDLITEKNIRRFQHMQNSEIESLEFSPDGNKLISCANGNDIKIWNANTGSLMQILYGHTESVFVASFSPNGNSIVSGSWDNTLKIWDAQNGELKQTVDTSPLNSFIYCLSISPDGQKIIAGYSNSKIVLFSN